MSCVAHELRSQILGGRVQKVLLPGDLAVGLEIYARHRRHHLLASAHAERGRLLLASEKLRRGLEQETGLLQLLRKYARGALVSAVEQPPYERILRLEFDHREHGCSELVIELMGRHSNIIFVDAGNRVLGAVKHVGPRMSPTRPILPGRPYTAPPPQTKLAPTDLTEYRLRQMLGAAQDDAQVWQILVKGLLGISPLLAREIVFRALGEPRAIVAQVERLTPLLETIEQIMTPLESGEWQPTIVLKNKVPVVYAPYPLTHRGEPVPMPSMSQALEEYSAAVGGGDPYAAARRPVQEAISKARTRLERRHEALQRGIAEAAEADRWREWGEWILAYAHDIDPGQAELVAEVGDGEVLVIPLDPSKPAVDNAQSYFGRYRKAQKAVEDGPSRLEEVNLALYDLEQLEIDLALATSRPEIDQVRLALAQGGHVRTKKTRLPKTGPGKPLSLTSSDGFVILVGRNSRQNDEVTFRRGSSDDWWFHARGVPGAHVIVRAEGKELPPATIQRAAELAAYYSGLQDEVNVVVDFTRRRHVRRMRGAAPGLVTYSQEQTIRVEPRGLE